jgi:xanthine/CO dehydrogenase XdhC/CoxF family maturation factor
VTVVVPQLDEPRTLSPGFAADTGGYAPTSNIYSHLVTMDWGVVKGTPAYGDLAERWETSADGRTVTFHLVRNATFHDGKPVTSADVKFTFDTMIRKKYPYAAFLKSVVEIQVPDAHTVVVKLSAPDMSFVPMMAQAAGYDVTLFGQEGLQTDLSRIGPLNITLVPSFRGYICPKPDSRTAVTLFFHDHENEARLLAQFLPTEALFIGAQGSLKARQRLLSDLRAQGVAEADINRLCPSFGLIGSCRDPRTLAVSVLAHVLSLAGPAVQAYSGKIDL